MKKITFLFLMLCATFTFAQVTTYPYQEQFEGVTVCDGGFACVPETSCDDSVPTGWIQADTDDGNFAIDSGSTGSGYLAGGSGQYYYIETSGSCTNTNQLVSETFDLSSLTAATAKLSVASNQDGFLTVEFSTDGGATWDPTPLLSYTAPGTATGWNDQTLDLSVITPNTNVAFRFTAGGADSFDDDLGFDNFRVEEAPTSTPPCTANNVSTPDAACGNFDTVLTWDASAGADGYYLTIGTSTGGNDVVDNLDLGGALTYTVSDQMIATDYFWTVSPYNSIGTSTCTENTYTTFSDGCYCESTPSSNDGTGIGNLLVGSTNFSSTGDNTYEDFTGTPVDLGQGISANVQITFETGYSYDTNIWIDLNDDYVFDDATELLYSGESLSDNPTTLDASFTMPADATLGQHRMRIGTADSGQSTPNSCYEGSYGVTMDLDVNIVAVSCTAPTATATLVTDCDNSQFFVDVDVTGLGDGTSQINDGTNTYPATTLGVVQVGPYADGTSVNLILENGTDSTCDLALGSFTYTCPIPGQLCETALPIASVPYTTSDDTANYFDDYENGSTPCSLYYMSGDDVFYTFTPSVTETYRFALSNLTGTYSGLHVLDNCLDASPNCVGFVGSSGSADRFVDADLVSGTTYYIAISTWASPQSTAYTLDVTIAPPANDECADAEALTLGTMVSGDTAAATDSGVAAGSCGATGGDQDIWYSFVATATMAVTVDTTADTVVIYDDTACTGGTEIACVGEGSTDVGGLTDGATYYARVYNSGIAKVAGPVDLTISETTLSTRDFNGNTIFSYYPNPVNNTLTLNAQQAINNVTIFNMLGQEVIRTAPNAVSKDVDMSNLQSGTYFVQVTVGSAVETVKIIKN